MPMYYIVACENLQLEIVQYLILHEIDVSIQDTSGCTALHTCARNGFLEGCILLLENDYSDNGNLGLDHFIAIQDQCGRTALHWSLLRRHYNIAQYILNHSTDSLNVQDNLGISPLHLAIFSENEQIVHELIERGADVNLQVCKTFDSRMRAPWAPCRYTIYCKRNQEHNCQQKSASPDILTIRNSKRCCK